MSHLSEFIHKEHTENENYLYTTSVQFSLASIPVYIKGATLKTSRASNTPISLKKSCLMGLVAPSYRFHSFSTCYKRNNYTMCILKINFLFTVNNHTLNTSWN